MNRQPTFLDIHPFEIFLLVLAVLGFVGLAYTKGEVDGEKRATSEMADSMNPLPTPQATPEFRY